MMPTDKHFLLSGVAYVLGDNSGHQSVCLRDKVRTQAYVLNILVLILYSGKCTMLPELLDLKGPKGKEILLELPKNQLFFIVDKPRMVCLAFVFKLSFVYFEQETPLMLRLESHVPVIFDLIFSHMQEQFFKQKTAQSRICYITDIYSLENFHFSSFTVYFNWPLEQPQTHGTIYSLIKAAFSDWCLP